MPKRSIDFRYTTLQRLRDDGITIAELSDVNAIRLIKFYSEMINKWTGQWFFPIKETINLSGKGRASIWREDLIPILEVDSITIDHSKNLEKAISVFGNPIQSGTTVLTSDQFETSTSGGYNSPDRIIELTTGSALNRFETVGKFPLGARNTAIGGTFGWLDQKDKLSTTISGALSTGDTTIVVADSTNMEQHDVARIGDTDPFIYVVISAVNLTTDTITFDTVQTIPTISSGAAFVVFGSLPEAIMYSTERLISTFKDPKDSEDFQESIKNTDLISEKMGDYQYMRQVPKYKNFSISGIREVDQILSQYTPPNIPVYI